MDLNAASGYREIAHTADWEIEVWAPDLSNLLVQSALGMYQLMGIQISPGTSNKRRITLQYAEQESLLIDFLNELLYLIESEEVVFDHFVLQITDSQLNAELGGAKLVSMDKEIKAATYHKLTIRKNDRGLFANIVFDV